MKGNKAFIIKQATIVDEESSVVVGNSQNHGSELIQPTGNSPLVQGAFRVIQCVTFLVSPCGGTVFPRPEKAFKWRFSGLSYKQPLILEMNPKGTSAIVGRIKTPPPSFDLKEGIWHSFLKSSSIQGGGVHVNRGKTLQQWRWQVWGSMYKTWVIMGWRWTVRTAIPGDIRLRVVASGPNDEIVRNDIEMPAFLQLSGWSI